MNALELADQLDRHAEHHFDAAQECDTKPCDTRNWEHFETSKHAASELRRLAAVEAENDDLLENGKQAVRWAPSSAHWSNELKRLFGEDAREGINVLESRLRDTQTERDALRELLREALESLTCGDTGDDLEDSHRCGRCDEYVDRNAKLRTKIRTALASTPASLQSAQQPTKSDEHKEILRECRNRAMRWTVKARIPEVGVFSGIAQDLDYLCEQIGVKND